MGGFSGIAEGADIDASGTALQSFRKRIRCFLWVYWNRLFWRMLLDTFESILSSKIEFGHQTMHSKRSAAKTQRKIPQDVRAKMIPWIKAVQMDTLNSFIEGANATTTSLSNIRFRDPVIWATKFTNLVQEIGILMQPRSCTRTMLLKNLIHCVARRSTRFMGRYQKPENAIQSSGKWLITDTETSRYWEFVSSPATYSLCRMEVATSK